MLGEWHKVIVLGSPSVGKSSFILRKHLNIFEDTLTTKTISHVFVETAHIYENEKYNLRLFEYQNSGETSSFFLDAEAAVIIYSRLEPETCRELSSWIEQIRSYCSKDHKIPIIICANKTDENYVNKAGIDFDRVQKQLSAITEVECCVETSCKTGYGVEEAFDKLVEAIKKREPREPKYRKYTGSDITEDDSIESTPWICCCFLFP